DLSSAEAEFRLAISLKRTFPEAQESLGETLLRRRQWSAAAGAFEEALSARPDSLEASNGLATTLLRAGQESRAREQFRKARELLHRDLMLHRAEGENNRGLEIWRTGDLPGAAAAFRAAIADDPEYSEPHNNL